MKLGLFDIMQIDPTQNISVATMFQRRLSHLALADDLKLDAAFFAERHFIRQYAIPSASVWLATAAQHVKHMRLGVLGYTLPIKEPVQLSEEIAVLDQLTGGRLEVGFGLGHRTEELQALGHDPAFRNQEFQARLAVVRGLLQGGTVTGDQYGVVANSVSIWPLPVQQPAPPLWFAGTDPKAAYWAASQGLGLAIGFKPSADLLGAVGAYKAGQMRARNVDWDARSLGSVMLMRNVYVADSDDQAMHEVTEDLLRLQALSGNEQSELSPEERREQQRAAVKQLITDEVMIAGSPQTVAVQIRETCAQLGVDTFLANLQAMGVDEQRLERNLRLLAGPVREALG